MRTVLGVDPGLSGGMAWLHLDGRLKAVEDMPVIGGVVNGTLMAKLLRHYETDMAVVERVSSRPGQGVASTFKFGTGYGVVLGVLQALEIPTYHMTPTEWKGYLKLGKSKELSRRMAVDRWPGHADRFVLKKNEGRAEAALIAAVWLEKHGRTRRIIRR